MSFVKAGVIGHPIAHSKSPIIHGHWIETYGLQGSYEAIDIAPDNLEKGVKDLIARGYAGFNVTVPHKESIFRLCMEIDDVASAIGAVNTVVIKDGALFGTNTDAYGFMENLRAHTDMARVKKAVILGAGGAARAATYGLLQAGIKHVVVTNRKMERAQSLTSLGDIKIVPWEDRSAILPDADLMVNTTALGMTGKDALEIDLSGMKANGVVYDIVYAPLMTDLLVQARSHGLGVVTGIGMLLHQARGGFERWFGVNPVVTPDLEKKVLG